jgi:ribosome assembly protein SQT1
MFQNKKVNMCKINFIYRKGHDGPVTCGCFSKDGKLVCSGGEDGSVRVWLPKSGVCKHVFANHFGHASMVTVLCSNEDGDLLLSGNYYHYAFFILVFTS